MRKPGSRRAVIVVNLVEESMEIANEQISREILEELSRGLSRIPWMKKVESVKIESIKTELY